MYYTPTNNNYHIHNDTVGNYINKNPMYNPYNTSTADTGLESSLATDYAKQAEQEAIAMSDETKANIGQTIKNGWNGMSIGQKANTIMGTVGTLMNAYNAYKANKLAKEQFNHAKQVSEQNWQAQRKQTNSQLEDRQRRRVEEAKANGRTTTSVGDYMAKYGI